MGLGVDRVCEAVQKHWPDQVILKIDAQSAGEMGIRQLRKKIQDAGIIIGTNALLRYVDNVDAALCAAVLVDTDLNQGSYNASEKAYRLYRQFFFHGRSAILQTYHPEDMVVQALQKGSDDAFFAQEIAARKIMRYPPFGHIFVFHLFGVNDAVLSQSAERFYDLLRIACKKIDASVYRPVQLFRPESGGAAYRITAKCQHIETLVRVVHLLITSSRWEAIPAKISIEIDPR